MWPAITRATEQLRQTYHEVLEPRLEEAIRFLKPKLEAIYLSLRRAVLQSRNKGSPPDDPSGPIWAGLLVIFLFFGVLGFWAAIAPLAGAAVAPGQIKVEGNRQSVQHRYGGTVGEILVKDGDYVEKGQVLARLDGTDASAKLESLTAQRDALKALEARLIAERDGKPEPEFDEILTSRMDDPTVASAIANQLALFRTRAEQFTSETTILGQKIAQLREQIEGARVQAESADRQRSLIEEELNGIRSLYQRGYAPKSKLLALERAAEELSGTGGARRADIAKANQAIGEAEIEMKKQKQTRLTEVTDGLRDAQTKLAELAPKVNAAQDVFDRTQLIAPASGRVVGMTIFTVGGVIEPGARVLDIVPSNGALIVEAQVRPQDVHEVTEGAPAEIRLTGMLGRLKPSLKGKVMTVSADRIEDSKSKMAYYSTQIRIDDSSLREAQVVLQAGMPADAMITTTDRSVLQYLLSPLSDQLARGFREE
ncbi:MAG: HlyD family type I secretion periplasmic adaptor subunit [Methyloceanibacter sp.]